MGFTGTIVFDLDGTLVDTAPDLVNALNYVLKREGLAAVPVDSARKAIGAGARRLIERGLELEGRSLGPDDITRLTRDMGFEPPIVVTPEELMEGDHVGRSGRR